MEELIQFIFSYFHISSGEAICDVSERRFLVELSDRNMIGSALGDLISALMFEWYKVVRCGHDTSSCRLQLMGKYGIIGGSLPGQYTYRERERENSRFNASINAILYMAQTT